MTKKKEIVQSVALFDEEPVKASKQTPSTSKKEEKAKTSKLSKETKSSPKAKETKKTTKKNGKDTTVVTASNKHASSDTSNSGKKKEKDARGTKSKRASSTSKKSGVSSKSVAKSTTGNKQSTKKSAKSDKSTEKSVSKRTTRGDKESSDRSTKASTTDGGEKQASVDAVSPDFVEAKKHKHVFTRGTEIWPPKQITGKPKPVKDGELVAIIVDGEYLEVSPWSVKDGVYRQGLDGNFLVRYLHYETVSTKYDAANEELNKIINKKEGK